MSDRCDAKLLQGLVRQARKNGVVYFGSDDFNLYALNARTGTKLWSFLTGDVVHSSPAIANGVVYFGSFDN